MRRVAKRAYYSARPMPAALADSYWRVFAGARRVLDVGCGSGEFGRYAPHGAEIHGVDVDERAVELASRFERARRADLESEPLPYEDEAFDAVLAKDVLEHVADAGALAQELHRVLRPGGVLVASVVMAKPRAVWADYTHVRGFTRRSAALLLRDAGFDVEAIWPMGPLPLSTRLGLFRILPVLLRLPALSWWAHSWELKAVKR